MVVVLTVLSTMEQTSSTIAAVLMIAHVGQTTGRHFRSKSAPPTTIGSWSRKQNVFTELRTLLNYGLLISVSLNKLYCSLKIGYFYSLSFNSNFICVYTWCDTWWSTGIRNNRWLYIHTRSWITSVTSPDGFSELIGGSSVMFVVMEIDWSLNYFRSSGALLTRNGIS